MLTVHHLQVSQSERIVWLCEELGIPYELVLHKRNPIFSPPELYAVHPLGAAPVIQDSAANLTLAESVACVEYICRVHADGALYLPPSHAAYTTFLYWLHFANGSLQPGMSRLNTLRASKVDTDSDGYKFALRKQEAFFAHLDEHLAKPDNEWLAGAEFTAADVMLLFSLTTMRALAAFDLSKYENVLAYVRRCVARPAYKRYRQKAEPECPDCTLGPSPPHFLSWGKK